MPAKYQDSMSELFNARRSLAGDFPIEGDDRLFWSRLKVFERLAAIPFAENCYSRSFPPPDPEHWTYEFLGALMVHIAYNGPARTTWVPLIAGSNSINNSLCVWSVLRLTPTLKNNIIRWEAGQDLSYFGVSWSECSLMCSVKRRVLERVFVGGELHYTLAGSLGFFVNSLASTYATPAYKMMSQGDRTFGRYERRRPDGKIDYNSYFVPSEKYAGLAFNF